MDAFGTRELRELLVCKQSPCVSLLMPTHVAGPESKQDPFRLEALLDRAQSKLVESGLRSTDARKMLGTAREHAFDPAFWSRRDRGVAIFAATGTVRAYHLPIAFREFLFVGPRFHTKPLLPLINGGGRFFLLALSQKNVRFFEGSRYALREVDLPELPREMEAALNYTDADRGAQLHTVLRANTRKQQAIFHGHGGVPDTHKDDLTSFFRMVDAALHPVLRDETSPVLLAAVEYLLPIYRSVSRYAHLAGVELRGNFDRSAPHELHQKAWDVMQPVFRAAFRDASERLQERLGTERASDDLEAVVRAANEGRVDSVFVSLDEEHWGCADETTGRVELHDPPRAHDVDLVDLAASTTFLHGGKVFSFHDGEGPTGAPAAAIFRY